METALDYGAIIRSARESAGWSLYRLAQESGITYMGLHAIERGRTTSPRGATLEAVARALGKTLPELLSVAA